MSSTIAQPMQPATVEFRVGTVLSRSLSVLLKNIVPFGLLSLLATSPLLYINWADATLRADTEFAPSLLIGLPIALILYCVFIFVLTAVLVYGVVREMQDRHAGVGESISRGLACLFPVIGVSIVFTIAAVVGVLLFVVPGVIVYLMFWVAVPVAVIERPGVFPSFSRSRFLTKGHRWQILGLVVLIAVVSSLLGMVVGAVGGVLTFAGGSVMPLIVAHWIVNALTIALGACAAAVGYYYLRSEKEGIGIDEIAGVFD